MPKYAVDFVAEIQEVTTTTNTTTNIYEDTNPLSDDLLTNCCPELSYRKCLQLTHPNKSIHRKSDSLLLSANSSVKDDEDALMGNALQCCCFQRYPAGCQSHRHVVISRGVQCNESNIKKNLPSCSSAIISICAPYNTLNNNPPTTISPCGDDSQSLNPTNFDHLHEINHSKLNANCSNNECYKKIPEIFTPLTQDPPELRDSSKFSKKNIFSDFKKCRKFFDDDIDSLSATISNYSLHEKYLKNNTKPVIEKLDNKIYLHDFSTNQQFEQVHTLDKSVNYSQSGVNITPTPRTGPNENWRGSTEAIRGSTSKTLTVKSNDQKNLNKIESNDNSDSFSSYGQIKDLKSNLMTNSGDNTLVSNTEQLIKKEIVDMNCSNNVLSMEKFSSINSRNIPLNKSNISPRNLHFKSINNLNDKKKSFNLINEQNKLNSNEQKPSNVVTFMRGSEELKTMEDTRNAEADTLNELRKKQKFLMRHSRSNSKQSGCININPSPVLSVDGNTNPGLIVSGSQSNSRELNSPKLNTNLDCVRPNSCSHNSNCSDGCLTPNNKIKRSVSFDKRNQNDQAQNEQVTDKLSGPVNCLETQVANFTRNSVRAKYCSSKILKQKFYIPESANIEAILRDPSDRRIKAICDRHNCDIEIYSKVPKSGFLKNIIILAAPNADSLRKCVRSLDCSMHWCLTAQLS